MKRKIQFEPRKTYKSIDNVDAAVEKAGFSDLRYFVMGQAGRFFPVFVGIEAVHRGVHFSFNVVG